MNKIILLSILMSLFGIQSCKFGSEESETTTKLIVAPKFDADAAYNHITQQLSFGPRVPGTDAQVKCATYLEAQLRAVTDSVYVQKVIVTQPVSNKKINCINIIGAINPLAATRILLLCHWDSRPYADNDMDPKNHTIAIDAADDGASGPGVLLEMARAIKQKKLDIGVDILFADVEDMGKSEWEKENRESTYCLGTRYWAQHPHVPNYRANYGVCLDMVGASNATFYLEGYSKQSAPELQDKIWGIAKELGHSGYFSYTPGGGITDDHVEVIKHAKIPCIDIINTSMSTNTGFAKHWHTVNDNIKVIDKKTLNAVGETLLTYLYNY